MSSKTGKRRGRRLNTTDEEQKKEDIEIIDDNQSNISTDTEKTEKDTSLKEIKDDQKDLQTKDIQTKDTKEIKDLQIKDSKEIKDSTDLESPKKDEKVENGDEKIENESNEIEQKTNGEHENLEGKNTPETCDLEPLILDSEEQELQFVSESDARSDVSELDKSPVINRCKTRRSLTRNLPTPKTPKTLEDSIINIPKIDEEQSEINDTISVESSYSEQTQESDMTNASVIVNFNDTGRNIDVTTTYDDGSNVSNFLDSTKDKSYGETLRCLTGRKTLRSNLNPRFYSSNIDLTDSSGKYSTLRGVKRKLEEEEKSTFMSYLSPFKKMQTEIPSSTPKLTGFKIGQVEMVEKNEEKVKKWCSIM